MSQPFKKPPYKKEDWINTEEALKLLNIKRSTLTDYIYRGRIPAKYISEGVSGIKFFHKPSLMGFNN